MQLKESTPNQMLSISELLSSICSGEQSVSIHNGPSNICPRNNSNVCNGKQLKYSSDFVLNSSDSGSTLNSCNDLPFLNIIDERNLISASTNTVLNGRSEEDKGSLTGPLSGVFASSRHPNKSYADAIKAPSQSSDTRRSCWNNNSCITTDADININQANKDVWEKELSINTSTSKLQKTVSIDSPRSDEKNSKINASSGCNGTRGCSTEEEAAALYGKSYNIIDERNLISASTNTVLNGRSEEDKGSLTGPLSGVFASSRHPNKSYADAIKAPSQSSDTRRSCWNNNSCITTDADININQANKDVWEKELSINTSTSKLQKTVSIDSPRSDEKNSKINASSGCNGTRGCSREEEASALYGKSYNIIDERNLISASTNTVLNGRSEEDKGSLTGPLSGLFASSRHPNKSYADAIKAPSQSSDTRRSCWNNNSCITTDADININQANKDVWEKELSINTSTSKLQKTVSIDSPRSDEKNSKINASSGCNGTRGCSTEEEAAALYGKSYNIIDERNLISASTNTVLNGRSEEDKGSLTGSLSGVFASSRHPNKSYADAIKAPSQSSDTRRSCWNNNSCITTDADININQANKHVWEKELSINTSTSKLQKTVSIDSPRSDEKNSKINASSGCNGTRGCSTEEEAAALYGKSYNIIDERNLISASTNTVLNGRSEEDKGSLTGPLSGLFASSRHPNKSYADAIKAPSQSSDTRRSCWNNNSCITTDADININQANKDVWEKELSINTSTSKLQKTVSIDSPRSDEKNSKINASSGCNGTRGCSTEEEAAALYGKSNPKSKGAIPKIRGGQKTNNRRIDTNPINQIPPSQSSDTRRSCWNNNSCITTDADINKNQANKYVWKKELSINTSTSKLQKTVSIDSPRSDEKNSKINASSGCNGTRGCSTEEEAAALYGKSNPKSKGAIPKIRGGQKTNNRRIDTNPINQIPPSQSSDTRRSCWNNNSCITTDADININQANKYVWKKELSINTSTSKLQKTVSIDSPRSDEKNSKINASNCHSENNTSNTGGLPISSNSSDNLGADSSEALFADYIQCDSVPEPPQAVNDSQLLPPAESDYLVENKRTAYLFELPTALCGYLIGKKGYFVKLIRLKTNAQVSVAFDQRPTDTRMVTIIGTESEIKAALEFLRERFPPNNYPTVTLEQVDAPLKNWPARLKISHPVKSSFELIVTSIVTANHFFVQIPTYYQMDALYKTMSSHYTQIHTPAVYTPTNGDIVCAPFEKYWLRAVVVNYFSESDECEIKYLDMGGYDIKDRKSLRQINPGFMQMPFQGIECYLADVECVGNIGWTEEAKMYFKSLVEGHVLRAIVAYYIGDAPCLYLYKFELNRQLFINQMLVNAGYLVLSPKE